MTASARPPLDWKQTGAYREMVEDLNFRIGLFATNARGRQSRGHCLVIYVGFDRDWPSRSMDRNGNDGMPLASAPATPQLAEYRASHPRAQSWHYNGADGQTADGMAEDLRRYGFDQATVDSFLTAAAPHWPVREAACS